MTKISHLLYLIAILMPISVHAQPDTVYVAGDTSSTGGNLNLAITSAISAGMLSNKIFKLESNARYILNDSILVPAGQQLTIVAPTPGKTQETALPQILWISTSGLDRSINIVCLGDLTLKNIWIFFAGATGEKVSSCILFQGNSLDSDRRCEFENVIIDYSAVPSTAGGSVTVACKNFNGMFKNCYWRNSGDPHLPYYGRAVSFPWDDDLRGNPSEWHIDSLVFENCTFANIGYVYAQYTKTNGSYADYVKFNHCTFLNTVRSPLESGWWNKLSVNNSVFVNTCMYGDILDMHWGATGPWSEAYGGTLRIDSISNFGFGVPFTEEDRRILFTHCSYYIENWLVDWMSHAFDGWRCDPGPCIPPTPQPMISPGTLRFFDSVDSITGQKVFPYINRASLYNLTNSHFFYPPTDTTAIKRFLYHKWNDSQDTVWAWKPENSINQLWPLEENLAYANDTLKTAGMGGFPLGDLYHWWPEKYQQWKAQEHTENANISYWLNTGLHYQDLNYVTAKSLLPKADSLMNTMVENAKLARIEGSNVNSYGKSSCWKFEYFWFDTSSMHISKRYYFIGQNNQVTFDRVEPLGVGPFRIANSWMDSDSALSRAEAACGANIRKQYPSCTVLATLFQWPSPPFITEWRVTYSYNNSITIFSIDASTGIVVSVEGNDNMVPTKFTLHQNYPNPFNPITIIKYALPNVGTRHVVSLRVYDILGRELKTLVNEHQPAGNYSVKFNANNLTSGIYFYRLSAGEYTATKKFVLLK